MSSYKKAARRIQAECGVKYTTAVQWVKENHEAIWTLVLETTGMSRHRDFPEAAAGLYRRINPE